jgi:gliding motility-associated-like protein
VYDVIYTIPVSGPCLSTTVSTTITITPRPTVVASYTPVICSEVLTDIVLTSPVAGTTYEWEATLSNLTYGAFGVNPSGTLIDINQIPTLINPLQEGTITYSVKPTANGCDGPSITFVIRVKPIPVIDSVTITPTSLAVCNGESINVSIVGSPSGTVYEWTAITNGVNIVGGVTSGTSTNGMINVYVTTSSPTTAGSIYFEITPLRSGCYGLQVDSNIVTVNPTPGTPIYAPDKSICSGDVASLVISVSNPFIAGTEVDWYVFDSVGVAGALSGTAVAPFTINDVLTTTQNAQGHVIYRVTSKLGDCTGAYTDYLIFVNPLPQPVLEDGVICVDLSTTPPSTYQSYYFHTGLSNSTYSFVWYYEGTIIPGATSTSYEATVAGTYSVIATNTDTDCVSEEVFGTVTESNPATSISAVPTLAFSDNATITVTVSGGNGVLQYQLDGNGFQDSNVFTGVSAGLHTVTVIDTQGCTYLTTDVLVIGYPNFFTPNGDGYNDYWNIIGLENQPGTKLYIFDRYGKLLKQLSTAGKGWDGTFNGQQLPSTDYWFTVEFEELGQQKVFRAHFSLVR